MLLSALLEGRRRSFAIRYMIFRQSPYLRLTTRWVSCKTLFTRATPTATGLGVGDWVKSHPLRAPFVPMRQPPKGRRDTTAAGRRARSKKSPQAARAAREPWRLVASTRFADHAPNQAVRCYRQRMPIEESFRDLKSQHLGEGLERSRSAGTGRFTVPVLIRHRGGLPALVARYRRRAWRLAPLAAPRQWQAPGLLALVPRAPADRAAKLSGRL
jgi:hypothetical protein